jgi:hypothetical protein
MGRQSNTSRSSGNGWWIFRRQPKEPEAAEDLGLPEIEPYYPNRLRNRIILGIVLVVVIVAVAVGVVLSKNGSDDDDDDKAVSVPGENRTVARNETTATATTLTERPTAAPSMVSIVDQFLAGLPAYSLDLAENDPDSVQAKALAWLDSDPQYHDYRHVYRLNQRYALAVLYHSTNGYSWENRTGWLSKDNECEWYINDANFGEAACGTDSRLTLLDLYDNDLVGLLPAEVELLTDLKQMLLGPDNGINGTIPNEM